jgi:hypothetical protein
MTTFKTNREIKFSDLGPPEERASVATKDDRMDKIIYGQKAAVAMEDIVNADMPFVRYSFTGYASDALSLPSDSPERHAHAKMVEKSSVELPAFDLDNPMTH